MENIRRIITVVDIIINDQVIFLIKLIKLPAVSYIAKYIKNTVIQTKEKFTLGPSFTLHKYTCCSITDIFVGF